MRKYLLGFVGLFMAMGVVLSSCKRDNNPQNTQNLTENEEAATATEFATFEAKEENEFCNVKLTIDYPIKGEQVYLDSVRRWIDNTLCRDAFDWEGGKLKKYRGDWSDGEKLVKHYAKAQLKTDMDEEEKSFLREMEVSYECAHTADVTFEGEQVTSMYFSTYVYAGGAHGGILSESATFYNNSGKRVGWEIFKDTKKVKAHIMKGLMKYFEVGDKQSLDECLLLSQEELPLPATMPFLNEQGVVLMYDQYEIAPYSAGMPADVITWKECQDYLTPEFWEMIKNDVEQTSTKKASTKKRKRDVLNNPRMMQ